MSNLILLKFKNKRIMPTKVLAEQYGATEKNIQDNNKTRFTEGRYYYKLERQALKDF